uniref:Uncharacterized protein n=1 Tax=Kalanchoe fedtschenkoi TaxID=63787 RepID=A0A7N0UD68_KALFE
MTFVNMSTNIYTDFIIPGRCSQDNTWTVTHSDYQLGLLPIGLLPLKARELSHLKPKISPLSFSYYLKAIMIRIRIAYKPNNEDRLEEGQVNNIPRNA